jgi:hypothetical protein
MPLALQAVLAGVALLAYLGFAYVIIWSRPTREEAVWAVLLAIYFALGYAFGAGALA